MNDTSHLFQAAVDYSNDVIQKNIFVCKYVRQACKRFLKDIKRKDLWVDHAILRAARKFASQIQHFKGDKSGSNFEILPFQSFLLANIYGLKRVINGKQANCFKYNHAYIEVPRKNGKTFLMSFCAMFDCLFGAKTGIEVYCAATRREQAKIIYDNIKSFITLNPILDSLFGTFVSRSIIYSKPSNRTNTICALGSDSKKLDGLNPFSVICDELHAWKSRELWDVLENAFGSRKSWHMLSITTAGHNRKSICWDEREHAVSVLSGQFESDNKFAAIYTLDKKDHAKIDDEKYWYVANPMLGDGKHIEAMRIAYQKAKQIPAQMNDFLNKQLNIWTQQAISWLSIERWKECSQKFDRTYLEGKECYVGIDLARVHDLSAVSYYFPNSGHCFTDFYAPQEDIQLRQYNDKVPYMNWEKQGFLTATPGNTTDYSFIEHDICKNAEKYNILQIGYDRHFAGEIVNNLDEKDFELIGFGMGFVSMNSPSNELERLIMKGEIIPEFNSCMEWNVENVITVKDAAGNIKPDKSSSLHRIDGVVSLIIAIGINNLMDKTENKEAGVRFLTL